VNQLGGKTTKGEKARHLTFIMLLSLLVCCE